VDTTAPPNLDNDSIITPHKTYQHTSWIVVDDTTGLLPHYEWSSTAVASSAGIDTHNNYRSIALAVGLPSHQNQQHRSQPLQRATSQACRTSNTGAVLKDFVGQRAVVPPASPEDT